jgi:hypothetical protein
LAIRSFGLRQPGVLAAVVPQRLDSSLANRARRGAQLLEEAATVLLDILDHLVGIEKLWWRCALLVCRSLRGGNRGGEWRCLCAGLGGERLRERGKGAG